MGHFLQLAPEPKYALAGRHVGFLGVDLTKACAASTAAVDPQETSVVRRLLQCHNARAPSAQGKR
jgi:hypothetical protein